MVLEEEEAEEAETTEHQQRVITVAPVQTEAPEPEVEAAEAVSTPAVPEAQPVPEGVGTL